MFQQDMLIDSRGYQYTQKIDKRRPNSEIWRCSYRGKNLTCKGQVAKKDGDYIIGAQHHTCPSQPGRGKVAEIRREAKDRGCKRVFDSGAEIAEEILLEKLLPGELRMCPTLPSKKNLAQQTNYKRQKTRPDNPTDLDFVMQEDHLADGFLQQDVRIDQNRHIILATTHMKTMLFRARTW